MKQFEPWTEEPRSIRHYRYLVRTSDADGCGEGGRIWPASGYVECEKWGTDDSQPWHFNHLIKGLSTQGGCCGLFGFLDGKLGGEYFSPGTKLGRTFQLLTVDLREVEEGFLFPEQRVPRAWVRCNGSYSDVCMALYRERTPYSELVLANLKASIAIATRLNNERNPIVSEATSLLASVLSRALSVPRA